MFKTCLHSGHKLKFGLVINISRWIRSDLSRFLSPKNHILFTALFVKITGMKSGLSAFSTTPIISNNYLYKFINY